MRGEFDIVQDYYNEVCRRAESNMLKTGRLEGAHYAAMQQVLEERRAKLVVEKPNAPQQSHGASGVAK